MVNLYPEIEAPGSKNVVSLRGTPGLSLFTTLGNAPVRGFIRSTNGTLVVIGGNTVYTVATNGTATSIGTITTSSGIVRMADNGTQIMIVDGSLTTYYTDLSTVTAITQLNTIISDNSYSGPVWCTSQDGYMIVAFPNSDNWYISAVDNATSWTSTDFTSADSQPGYIQAIISHRDEIWILKDRFYEVWYNSGNASFPFERHQGAEGEIGCIAPQSVDRIGNSLYWIGSNEQGKGIVWKTQGYTPIPVSSNDIIYQFSRFTDISDAISYTYQQEGHVFYVLNFPTANETWCYDESTEMWHRRGYLNPTTNTMERQRGYVQILFNQKDYVGDYETGKIYELDLDTYTDNTVEIQRTWTSPHVHKDRKRLYFQSFEMDMESGVGLNSGQGRDPQAMLQWADDGGHTFGNEYWAPIGKQGEYKKRIHWHRLGVSRSRVFRMRISDPVKVVLISAHADVEIE